MSKIFEENCSYFEYKNPRAAALLSFASEGAVRLSKTALGEPNLVEGECFFHDPSGAMKEADSWANELIAKNLTLQNIDILTIFGLGLGYGYFALKKWLDKDSRRNIIFLEDDLRVLLHFLDSPFAKELLCHPRVHIYYIEDSPEGLHVIQGISWGTFGKKMHITAFPYYAKSRAAIFEEIKNCILFETSDIHATLDEYMAYGAPFFHNFWRNLFLLPEAYRGNELRHAFAGIPAIVVAAGPSLAKHLESLKDLRDRALIFSGGSSVNALLDAGVVPHFGAGIDPNPLQYLRLRQGLAFQVPFFFRHRLLHEAASMISGPLLYLRGGDGYNISEWFEKRLHIKGEILGGGHSVANFGIEIARDLGCNPIILVGFDLAYGDELQLYAPGVEESVQPRALSEVVVVENHEGKKINTEWKWVLEGKWIEDFAEKHPRTELINATEGGLGFTGLPHMSFAEAVEKWLSSSFDLQGLVHTVIQDAGKCASDYEEIFKGVSLMYDSLSRSINQLEVLAEEVLKAKQNRQQTCESPEFIMTQKALQEEIAFAYVLEVFDRMKIKLEFYCVQFASHPTQKKEEGARLELDLLGDRFLFLKQVATLNQKMIIYTVRWQQEQGRDITAFCPKSEVVW